MGKGPDQHTLLINWSYLKKFLVERNTPGHQNQQIACSYEMTTKLARVMALQQDRKPSCELELGNRHPMCEDMHQL